MTRLLVIAPQASHAPDPTQTPAVDGVCYHRLMVPYGLMARSYPNDFEIHCLPALADHMTHLETGARMQTWDYVAGFEAVICSRLLHNNYKIQGDIIRKIKKTGAKLIVDIDDYWMLNSTHLLYNHYTQNGITGAIVQLIKAADLVTTTQTYLRDKVMPYNTKVALLPNGIDGTLQQFGQTDQKPTHDLLRVGWLGGVHHLDDIRLLKSSIHRLLNEDGMQGRVQFVLGGFNAQLNRAPDDRIFIKMERLLTDNYTLIKDAAYRHHLLKYNNTPYPDEHLQPYRRLWAKDIDHYATLYHEIDLALAPLCDNTFNRCKSPLKIIEAGWFGVPVVCSDVFPYRMDDSKGITRIKTKDKDGFYNAIQYYVTHPDRIENEGKALQQYVHGRYDMAHLIKSRMHIINQILNRYEPATNSLSA